MVRNVRWLYNKLGTTDFSSAGSTVTGALSGLQNSLSDKAESSHSHSVSDLPISNSLSTNSTSYVPSSAAVYSLKSTIDSMSSEIEELEVQVDPNNRYESKDLGRMYAGTLTTLLSRFNHDNLYKDGNDMLSVGNYFSTYVNSITIRWVIAGFDLEHNQTAADGTVYDNGYGICLIPKDNIGTSQWTYMSRGTVNGYYGSSMNIDTLTSLMRDYRDNVFGSHLVYRNILLSSAAGGSGSTDYTWDSKNATLMSIGQITGTFAQHTNQYDDGEATYKLPLFDHEMLNLHNSTTGPANYYYTRNIGSGNNVYVISNQSYRYVIEQTDCFNAFGLYPLIYIR